VTLLQPSPTTRRIRSRSLAAVVVEPLSASLKINERSAPPRRARTRTLRVAVVHGVGFFYSGGGEKLVIQQVLGLRERGHEVDCYAPIVDAKRSFPGWLEQIAARRLAPRLPAWLRFPDALAIIAMSVAAPLLARRLRAYDVVLAANQPAGWVAWWARRLYGVPYVLYLAQPNRLLYPRAIDRERTVVVKQDYLFLRAIAPLIRPLVQWADRHSVAGAREALANGRYMTRVLSHVYGRTFRSCPAGAEIVIGNAERFAGTLRVNGALIRKPFVLLTNRHYPQKRFEVAIESLRDPALAATGASLVITGQETEYTDRLRAMVARLGLSDRVHFIGLASEADLAALYASAASYVYPSPEEDYGMGVVEAMAAATPVVAWDHAGPTGTMVDGVTGFLVPPDRPELFAERTALLITDKGLSRRLGRAAQERVIHDFTFHGHIESLEDALDDAAR
jgi:glycosyltransferase involved in cell wall biosynthesis